MAVLLVGCEQGNPGKRKIDVNALDGPFPMKIQSVAGANRLVVINTGAFPEATAGSMQFYDIGTSPTNPKLGTIPSFEVPTNVNDFVFENDTVYVAARNDDYGEYAVYIYDLVGSHFQQRVDADGAPTRMIVSQNPQKLLVVTLEGKRILAVVCQTAGGVGTIHYFRIDDNSFKLTGPSDASASIRADRTADAQTLKNLVGTYFFMSPLQQLGDQDDPISLSSSERNGYGINGLVVLDPLTSDPIFVTANYRANGLFGFRAVSWENTSNLAWDLNGFRNGFNNGSTDVTGSGEQGFRGLAIDGTGTVFMSSRTDNVLYRVPPSILRRKKTLISDSYRNTFGYSQNDQGYGYVAHFDADLTDDAFPRLGDLILDCATNPNTQVVTCDGGASASFAWVLGMGDGDSQDGRIYKVDLHTQKIVKSNHTYGREPQKVVRDPVGGYLYVAHPEDSSIAILRASDLEYITKIVNP